MWYLGMFWANVVLLRYERFLWSFSGVCVGEEVWRGSFHCDAAIWGYIQCRKVMRGKYNVIVHFMGSIFSSWFVWIANGSKIYT